MSVLMYYLQTFGCKSNQYESQAVREALNARGHIETASPAGADLFIINTCGVTGRAGATCRNAIRKVLRANPGIRVVITGCGVDLEEPWPEFPDNPPLCVPNARKHALVELLDATAAEAAAVPDDRFGLAISRFHGHTRAFIKIQDGCDNFCSYCAVPYARGKPVSRPKRAILDEARRLVDNGHGELVLTGINIGAYSFEGVGLPDLLSALARTPGLTRLRLGSIEPPYVTEDLVRVMADSGAICPHIHLPLQSGDDAVLARMARRYTAREFMDKVAMLRRRLEHPAITTDIIVGFPGEDAAAVRAGEDVCRKAGFARMHVFLFSPRPGTPAASMPRVATDREVEERKSGFIRLGGRLSRDYAAGCVGLTERVIVERSGGGLSDRYVRVELPGDAGPPGAVAAVVITGVRDGELLAERLPRDS